MNKGDKFVVELEYQEKVNFRVGKFALVGANDDTQFIYDSVEKAAAAYAAKQVHPAPVAQDWWQPKVGDRVIMEAVLSHEYTDGDCLLNTQMSDGEKWEIICARSAIVGPAPVRARFAVGDEVIHLRDVRRCTVISTDGRVTMAKSDDGIEIGDRDDMFITIDEARERLGK